MEKTLFLKHGNQQPKDFGNLITANDNPPIAIAMHQYKEQSALDQTQLFVEWRVKQENFQVELFEQIKQNRERYEQQLSEMTAQYENLYTQNLELQRKLEEVYQESLILKQEREEKVLRKLKKKRAKKLPLRDTVDLSEFEQIVSLVKGRNKAKEQRRFALALLFITGLRVSNLLLFHVSNGKELLEKGNTTIQVIKGGEKRLSLRLGSKGRNLLLKFKDDYIKLSTDKKADQPLFTTPHDLNSTITRETFDKEVNKILTKASAIFEKHIRTHSFRATIVTQLLKHTPIELVKEVMGHKPQGRDLDSKRSRLQPREVDKILSIRSMEEQRE